MTVKEELACKIQNVFDSSKDFSLNEDMVLEIQQAVLAGSYEFSPLCIVALERDDPLLEEIPTRR